MKKKAFEGRTARSYCAIRLFLDNLDFLHVYGYISLIMWIASPPRG
jgi:hypothetical protein